MMNAGASMLFYQNANARLQPVTIPAFLQVRSSFLPFRSRH